VLSVGQKVFRISWRSINLLLVISAIALVYSASWEYSVRRYLDGFADAIVPAGVTPEQRVQAILDWMRNGPPRSDELTPTGLAMRDPENTLNYQQLLSVCGTATNAFLNLARSSDLQARRLLLLTPDRNTKHVVAEVHLNGRWVVVDPTYRVILRNAAGELVTKNDLKNPHVFAEVIGKIPGYPAAYNYENFAHVRVARLPVQGLQLRHALDRIFPGWDEKFDWSLLLERESFFVLTLSAWTTFFLCILRLFLGWFADKKLKIPRFHLREHLARAGSAFFTTPEIK
jgi:transglutaminase-like putative cysteine protease